MKNLLNMTTLKEGLGEESTFASFHPLVTFLYFGCVIGITMFSMHPLFLAVTLICSAFYSFLLGGVKQFRLILIVCIPILLLTAVINPLFNHKGVTVLFFLNGNPMTLEAILYGLAAASMLVSVIIWFGCFNKVVTSDKFIYLFGRILPVLSLVLSMCFRYVPLLKNRFREISEGQRCMGRQYGLKHPVKRLHQLAREISILIAWTLETSSETADSMEERGYGLRGRTSFHLFKFTKRDGCALGCIAALTAIVIVGCIYGVNNIYYYPAVTFQFSVWITAPVAATYFILLALPIWIDIRGERRWAKLSFEA